MRRTVLIAGITLLAILPSSSNAQGILNWLLSYVPGWSSGNTSGTAYNISGTGVNCATNVSLSGGSFSQALGSSGAQTPTVSGATFTVPGSTTRLQVTPNFSSNSNACTILNTFSAHVTNVTFRIADIDKADANSSTYFDRVTITGSDGVTTYNPTITKYDAVTDPNFLVISGNSARVNTNNGQAGNSDSDAGDQRGTITVNFGSVSLTSVTIKYDNAPGAQSNPADQAIAVGSFSFTMSTLPLILTDFSGHRQSQDVLLNWSTRQEINTSSFTIERSNDNNNWTSIGSIPASGNNNDRSDYGFTDRNPQGSAWYYRLKQIDIDGHFKYSAIIRITMSAIKTTLITYPNPFTNTLNINLDELANEQVLVSITDAAGNRIYTETRGLFQGNNNFTITGLDKLSKGVYYLEIQSKEFQSLPLRSKLIKN